MRMTRSFLQAIEQSAKRGDRPPIGTRAETIAAVRTLLDDQTIGDRLRARARTTLAAMIEAAWDAPAPEQEPSK